MTAYFPLFKKFVFLISLLLGGSLPVFLYIIINGKLNVSELTTTQLLNSSGKVALMFSLFNIKPIYMFLCVLILIILWGRASIISNSMFLGLACLLLGEIICGSIFASFQRELIISEHIHSYGIMLEFTFITFAFVKWTQQHSIFKMRNLFWIALFGIFASYCLLAISTTPSGYFADLFGFPYTYIRYEFNQWVESRFLPITSISFFLLTIFTILKLNNKVSIIFFSVGIGLLTFSILRLTLGSLFAQQLIWFEFWEEMSQFILMFTITLLLWKYKRKWIIERIALFG